MATSDITIIIPTRDRLWSLPRAVQSCRSNRLRIEIIVVDDGSRDGTREWLHAQPDIIVINGEGWGKPWGVNQGLGVATGKYLRYLDSDDWLNAGANEMQFDIAETTDADLVVSGMDVYQDDVLKERYPWPATDDFMAQQLGEEFGSHYSAFLFRRDFVKDIPHRTLFPSADFASRDDRCLILEVAMRNPRISVSGSPALAHRFHDKHRLQFRTGLRSTGTHIQQLYIYQQILDLLEQRGELTSRRKQAAIKVLWPLAHWIGYSHARDAEAIAEWIKSLDPDFRPPDPGPLGWMYRTLGFRQTQRVLRIRRRVIALQKTIIRGYRWLVRPFGKSRSQSASYFRRS